MARYEVVPHVGVGPVRLGMSRQEGHQAMPGQRVCFRKGGAAREPYHDAAFQVYYAGDPPTVEYIQLSAGPGLQAVYRGVSVFEAEADELVRRVAEEAPYDEADPELGYSYVFPELELSLWRPVVPVSE